MLLYLVVKISEIVKMDIGLNSQGNVFSEYDTRFDIAAASRTQTGSPTIGTLAGTVEIRIDGVNGTLIGTANINTTSTGNWTTYQITPVGIAQTTGTHEFVFRI